MWTSEFVRPRLVERAPVAYPPAPMKKAKPLPHRNRRKTARLRAKLKAKHRKMRLRKSRGESKFA